MYNAIWFSRHKPTAEQLAEFTEMDINLVDLEAGLALGARNLQTEEDAWEVLIALRKLCKDNNVNAVYGVFPVPIQATMRFPQSPSISCWASWNVQRTVEGEKPTFVHKEWLLMGHL